MGVVASAAFIGLVVVEVAPFLSQRSVHCEGQCFAERQASSGQAVRDVEIYQEVQWDEEKWLNQNCCPGQNMELE